VTRSKPMAPRATTTEATRPTLPPSRAFVVQVHADAEPARGVLVGRVEHLASGSAARFSTPEELVSFINETIHNTRKENHPHE
jgi:hypothetical protein